MWLFNRLANRNATIREGIARGTVNVEQEILRLMRDLKDNRVIQDFASHPGWKEIDDQLGRKAILMLKQLPQMVLDGKIQEATRAAAYIVAANDLLGIVNLTLFESQRCKQLVDQYINVQERMKEQ